MGIDKSYLLGTLIAVTFFASPDAHAQSNEATNGATNKAASASSNAICYDIDLTGTVTFKVDYKKHEEFSRPPILANSTTQTPKINEAITINSDIDKDALYTALRDLKDDWSTPTQSWAANAVRVTVREDRNVVCRFAYTKNRLFSQTQSLQGFIVQPISSWQFRQLNKAIFGKESI